MVFDSQRTEGTEASLDARVTDHWHVLANMTVQDAIITDEPQNLTQFGAHPQGVPAYIANLWTTYDFSIAVIHGFQIGGGLNYRNKTFSDLTMSHTLAQEIMRKYAESNLRLSAQWFEGREPLFRPSQLPPFRSEYRPRNDVIRKIRREFQL